MKLETVQIDNYRAIEQLRLPLDPNLTVLHGGNTCGKTSVLSAVAVGLGAIPDLLPGVSGIDFLHTDLRTGESAVQVDLTAADGLSWRRERVYGSPGSMTIAVLRTGTVASRRFDAVPRRRIKWLGRTRLRVGRSAPGNRL